MLLPPPQLAIVNPARINRPAVALAGLHTRLRRRGVNAKNRRRRKAATAISSGDDTHGSKKNQGSMEFAVVAMVTVALAVELDVKSMTLELSELPVVIEQLAFGAVVEQDR